MYQNKQEAMAAVAEITDRTAYNALINDHLYNNILSCSQQHKNGNVMTKARFNLQVKCVNLGDGSLRG